MEDSKIGFFTKFINSLSRPQCCREYYKEPTGKVFLYLFYITLLLGTISLIRPLYEFNTGLSKLESKFNTSVRDFTFENGQLNVEGEMPIIFKGKNEIYIVDTTGQTDKSILDDYKSGILITKDWVVQKDSAREQTIKLSDLQGFSLTKSNIENIFPYMKIINIFIVVFGLIGFYIGKIFSTLIVALLGLIVAAILKINLSYGNLYKLSAYALTFPIVLSVFLGIAGIKIPYFYELYCLIGTVYLYFSLKGIKEEEN